MTDEQKVKQHYPDNLVFSAKGFYSEIWSIWRKNTWNKNQFTKIEEGHSESDAWADAARRIEATHETT